MFAILKGNGRCRCGILVNLTKVEFSFEWPRQGIFFILTRANINRKMLVLWLTVGVCEFFVVCDTAVRFVMRQRKEIIGQFYVLRRRAAVVWRKNELFVITFEEVRKTFCFIELRWLSVEIYIETFTDCISDSFFAFFSSMAASSSSVGASSSSGPNRT